MCLSAPIRVLIWSLVAVALCVLLGVGLMIHEKRNHPQPPVEVTESEPEPSESSQNSTIQPIFIETPSASFEGRDIRKVKIEWVSGSIQIYPGAMLSFDVKEPSDLDEEKKATYEVSGDTLIIREYKQNWNFSLGFNLNQINDYASKDLTLTVPAELSKLTIETVSSDVRIYDGLTMGELDIEAVSACVDCGSIAVDKLDIETVSGDVELTLMNEAKNIDMETVSGDLTLHVPEEMGFTAETNSVSGDTNTDMTVTGSGKKMVHGDGKTRIQMDSVSGNLYIYKTR